MSASRRPPNNLPGLPVIRTRHELDEHDPLEPALLEIPPALVRPLWIWLRAMLEHNDLGDLCRNIELLLVGIAEPDTRLVVSSVQHLNAALGRIIETAQRVIADDEVIPVGDGEDDVPDRDDDVSDGDDDGLGDGDGEEGPSE